MAESYGTRPSELLGLEDPWTAFCLDEALTLRLSREREGDDQNGFSHPDSAEGEFDGMSPEQIAEAVGARLTPPSPELIEQMRQVQSSRG